MPTPQEILSDHEITRRLRALGLTDAQLASIRYYNRWGFPFRDWSITWVFERPDIPFHLKNAYCALKWLLLEQPPDSPDRTAAWDCVGIAMALPFIELGINTVANQRGRAKKPRGRLENGQTLEEIVHRLAVRPEHRESTSLELWRHLFATLEELDLDPKEIPHSTDPRKAAYEYNFRGKRKKLSFGQFSNLVSEFRKSLVSA